jgi:UDP-N-acetylglucosamine--N-acetylmuramyl-(pentapeptide) pyrophosphoryl-undecaprenol N-acetylglucosamine transferase
MVLGGSQGAHALNQAVLAALPLLADRQGEMRWIHQTGPNDLVEVQQAYQKGNWQAQAFDFSSQLQRFYSQSHLVVCRAGAGTITELRLMGLPSILVPYPYATDDHQRFNALEMVEQGAALMCLNADLSGSYLNEYIRYFMDHPDELEAMGSQALSQAKPHAAAEVLEICLKGAAGKGHGVQKKR